MAGGAGVIMNKTTVAIIGAKGRMGKVADKAIASLHDFEIVARLGRGDNVANILSDNKPDVAIELSGHDNVLYHSKTCLDLGIKCVIGSSGLNKLEIDDLSKLFRQINLGGLLVPNFSLAVAKFSKTLSVLSKELNPHSIRIIEYHHTNKKDSPSGTARHLAEILGVDEGVITSIRDDKYDARHDVIFNVNGEEITYMIESTNRDTYIEGIQKACEYVRNSNKFIVGLENII